MLSYATIEMNQGMRRHRARTSPHRRTARRRATLLEAEMLKIFGAIYILTAPTIMGILIVALLSMNMFDSSKIIMAAAAGAVVALDEQDATNA